MDTAPYELIIGVDGSVLLPLGLLAQAGLDPGSAVLGVARQDGYLVLRRLTDATDALLLGEPPV